ncbi:DAK2 domain-containing protein [Paenarthrobacter sp. NPDC090522]|uniref:DAK2 domain-containing protein n=1 Tax=Paenarthrobacter sp. NPDC090522 TaxID=3364383 RepID=UPI0037F2533C
MESEQIAMNLPQVLDSSVLNFDQIIKDTKSDLTHLDMLSGDGDFGENLAGGLAQTIKKHQDSDGETLWSALVDVFLDDVGGTSGPLFGLLFHAINESAAESAAGDDSLALLASGFSNGLDAIQRVGEAQVGDRTLVDALAPAVVQLKASSALNDFDDVVSAAVKGAQNTSTLVARRGRSSYVGDRAVGVPDPGAVGVALLFIALGAALGTSRSFTAEVSELLSVSGH